MSLRRRIAVAAALAVAAVAVAISVIGYVSTRSHLVGDLKGQLHSLAAPYLQPHHGPGSQGPSASGRGPQDQRPSTGDFDNRNGFHTPSPPEFGAARGYFQVVYPDGSSARASGEQAALPVDRRAVEIAKRAHGSFFTTATVKGVHLEILTIGDRFDHWAVQVALPLTSVDS
ncbi:MAG: hypothetical protein JO342_19550, partial [Solirubrobacterales bacterium]|nr:hypothetical protein [Solirubrobacterales bacterium]